MNVQTPPPKANVYSFDRFTLDLVRGALLAAGGTEVALRPKAFALLRQLVENAGRLIDRDEIMAAIWPGVIVTEDSITQTIKEIRRALGDGEQRLLRTVPKRGFLFAAEVSRVNDRATLVVLPSAPDHMTSESCDNATNMLATPASRPMLAVLPFANMTGDPGQDYFADGMTEDLTTELSHLRWFSVIARSSAFIYKGQAVDVRQVGRDLGVGYVLQGSVRRAGNRVRIATQLCETEAGTQVWAGRFDGDLTDIFDLQDRLTESVVGAIEPSLHSAEVTRTRAKPTESLTAYDLYLRALLQRRLVTREGNDEALGLLRRAIAIDPTFTAAKGMLAGLHTLRVTHGWADDDQVEEAIRLAHEVVDVAGEEAPSALAWAGYTLAALGRDYVAGSAVVQRALMLAPNSAQVLLLAGWDRLFCGDGTGAITHFKRALHLNPADPAKFYVVAALSRAKFVLGRYEEAAEVARQALADGPNYITTHRILVASYAHLGDQAAVEKSLRDLLALAPGYTISKARAQLALRDEQLINGLRKAGLPE